MVFSNEEIQRLKQAIHQDLSGDAYIERWESEKKFPGICDQNWSIPLTMREALKRPLMPGTDEAELFSRISDGFRAIIPSRTRSKDYEILYVFPDEEPDNSPQSITELFDPTGEQGNRPLPVNLKRFFDSQTENGSGGRGALFPETLATVAHRTDNQSRCYLICAERGAGKSVFLGYLFSVYHKLFLSRKVAWIRLDVSRHIMDFAREESQDRATRPFLLDHFSSHGLWVMLEKYIKRAEKQEDGIGEELKYDNFRLWLTLEQKLNELPHWLNWEPSDCLSEINNLVDMIGNLPHKEKNQAFQTSLSVHAGPGL